MNTTLNKIISILGILFILVSCEVEVESESDIAKDDKPKIDLQNELQGKIKGDNWKYNYAVVKKSSYDGENMVYFYDEDLSDPCLDYPSKSFAFYRGELKKGKKEFSMKKTMTLYDGSTNLIITNGFMKINKIDGKNIDMTLKAYFDKNNYIGGIVTIEVCE